MDLDSLRDLMTKRLSDAERGVVLCDVSPAPSSEGSDERRLSSYLSSRFGFSIDPGHLKRLAPDVAHGIALRVIEGLSSAFLPPTPSADEKGLLEFLAHFASGRRYYSPFQYTFGPRKGEVSRFGRSLHIGADLDEGILVVDETKVGILWMADYP